MSKEWHRELAAIVGEDGLLPEDKTEQYIIDGRIPEYVVFPSQIEQIQEIMRWANASQARIIPTGNGSKLGMGNPPERVEVLLSTQRLNQVVEYEPADLTITAQSGLFLNALEAELRDKGQFMPLDPPYEDLGTLGGTLASNVSGPMRLKYGTARDIVIGLRVVQPDGTVIKGGGKVVKNVAGYDLSKLYVGSFGTLGVVIEWALKLQPLPAESYLTWAEFGTVADAVAVGQRVIASQLVPTVVSAATGLPAAQVSSPGLILGADGHPETVRWQQEQFERICHETGARQIQHHEGDSREALHRGLRSFPEAGWSGEAIVCKATVLGAQIADILSRAEKLAQASDLHIDMLAHVGNGIIYFVIHPCDAEPHLVSSVSITKQLRQIVNAHKGFLVVESAPLPAKENIDVWGSSGNSFPLMRRIKEAVDPNAILNPGRFIGGL